MTPEDAFLQEIAANPADDAPRLVYADWLEERDDPRGRYLRAEVELARLAEGDPAYAGREAELQELREAVEPEWLAAAGKRYDLWLLSYRPECKIFVIKTIRELTGLGLREAKDASEALPNAVLRGVARAQAEYGREQLRYSFGKQVAEVKLGVAGAPAPAAGDPNYDVVLRSYPSANKAAVIRAVREATGLGRVEARDLAERLPNFVATGVPRAEAERVASLFRWLAEVSVVDRQTAALPAPHAAGGRFDLVLTAYPPERKIAVIKVIRELMGEGLKEAKELSEALPAVIRAAVTWPEVQAARAVFTDVGEVVVRATPPGSRDA
jgi:uncharacterized protein (TIGR02996 family)